MSDSMSTKPPIRVPVTVVDEPCKQPPNSDRIIAMLCRPNVLVTAAIGAVAGLACGVVIGVWLSQYHPIFGGLAVMGQPWSPARMSLIGVHVITLGVISTIAGTGIGVLLGVSMSPRR